MGNAHAGVLGNGTRNSSAVQSGYTHHYKLRASVQMRRELVPGPLNSQKISWVSYDGCRLCLAVDITVVSVIPPKKVTAFGWIISTPQMDLFAPVRNQRTSFSRGDLYCQSGGA